MAGNRPAGGIPGGPGIQGAVEAMVTRLPGSGIEAPRLRRLPRRIVFGLDAPSAETPAARLTRAEVGPGLLIPGCRAIHTFGMRFPLDVLFLGGDGLPRRVVRNVGPRRLVADRGARTVLELPSWRPPTRIYDQETEREDIDAA